MLDAGDNTVTTPNSITLSGERDRCHLAVHRPTPLTASAGVADFAGCNLTGTNGTYTLHATNGTAHGRQRRRSPSAPEWQPLSSSRNTVFGPAVNGVTLAPQPASDCRGRRRKHRHRRRTRSR